MVRVEDHGQYYVVPLDERDLNYGAFFETGQKNHKSEKNIQFNSHNTTQLTGKSLINFLKDKTLYQSIYVKVKNENHDRCWDKA